MRTSVGGLLFVWLAVATAAAEEIQWAKNWDEAQKAAASGGKLIMVDFFTDWCGWCKRLDKDTYTNADVIKLSRELVNFKTDAEKEGLSLAKKYGVTGFPTILFLDKSGELVGRIIGYMPPAPFAKEVTRIRDAHADLPKIEARLKDSPDDGEANARLAEILAMRGKRAEAEAAIAKAESAKFSGESLARAYNGVADAYQNDQKLDQAVALFKKADAMSKDAETRAYAKVSLMFSHRAAGNLDAAKAVAREILELKDAPADTVEMAKKFLEQDE